MNMRIIPSFPSMFDAKLNTNLRNEVKHEIEVGSFMKFQYWQNAFLEVPNVGLAFRHKNLVSINMQKISIQLVYFTRTNKESKK